MKQRLKDGFGMSFSIPEPPQLSSASEEPIEDADSIEEEVSSKNSE